MNRLSITETQMDELLKAAHDVYADSGELRCEDFHAALRQRAPGSADVSVQSIEFALAAYYEFSTGTVVRIDLDDHDKAAVAALS